MRRSYIVLFLVSIFWILGANDCGGNPPSTLPVTPTSLTANPANAQVTLNWTKNTEADLKGYNLYWGTQSGNLSETKFIAKTQSTTTISGLTNNKKYFFAIDAENNAGKKSPKSSEVSATPSLGPQLPATPKNLSAKAANAQVTLNWTKNTETDLKGYNVYWGTQSGKLTKTNFVVKTQATTVITGLSNGTKYFFAIDAQNNVGKKSAKSAEVSATPIDTTVSPGDPEGHAPGRSGEVKTITVNGSKITYEVIDGLAIYQGDIVLGKAEQVKKTLERFAIGTQGITCDEAGWFSCKRWPNAVVRYEFKNDWGSSSNNSTMRARIRAAIAHWELKTNLQFVESSSGDRIYFRDGNGCSSKIGLYTATNRQNIRLSMDCIEGSVVHEIGHAIGLFHEQSREDRNSFVTINRSNIRPTKRYNFDQQNDDARDIGNYDFGSIMHYGCWAFLKSSLEATDANRTIVPLDGTSCNDIGQRDGLSEGDILAAYTLYPPTFTVNSSRNSIPRNQTITFSLDYDIEPVDDAYVSWTNNHATGTFDTGNSASIMPLRWPVGEYRVIANIVIADTHLLANSKTFTVTNVAPVVDVFAPTNNAEFCSGDNVTFRATAVDVDTFPGQVLPNSRIAWRVGSAAPFATGATATRSFTAGNYTITARGTDADGASHEDSVRIRIVSCTNAPPVVTISNPADAPGSGPDVDVWGSGPDVYGYYHEITLQGSATDAEDGTLTGASLVWRTNRADAQPGSPASGSQILGTGNAITVKLYAKGGHATTDHIITLTATDSNGNHRSKTRLIRVKVLQ